jgi:hypothetical protein
MESVYYSFYGLFESTTWQEAPDSAFAEFTKLQLQSYKIENVRLLNRKQYKISDLFPPVKWSKPQSKTATNQPTKQPQFPQKQQLSSDRSPSPLITPLITIKFPRPI